MVAPFCPTIINAYRTNKWVNSKEAVSFPVDTRPQISYCCKIEPPSPRLREEETHRADPPPRFPPHRPVPMCPAYRCICIHLRPWIPCHCYCRVCSGRGRSQQGTPPWPYEGSASSRWHTEPPLPARTAAATADTRIQLNKGRRF